MPPPRGNDKGPVGTLHAPATAARRASPSSPTSGRAPHWTVGTDDGGNARRGGERYRSYDSTESVDDEERRALVASDAARDEPNLESDLARMSDGRGSRRPPRFSRLRDGRTGDPLLPTREDDAEPGAWPREAIEEGEEEEEEEAKDEMDSDSRRGRSSRDASPLMGSARSQTASFHSRRSTLRSRSPDLHASATAKKKYTFAAFFLVLCLVAFVLQTELSAYVQQDLGWNKAYCMLYLTHGSWALLWPVQLLVLRVQQYNVPWPAFWRRHVALLRSTSVMVQTQDLDWSRPPTSPRPSPVNYLVRMTALVTTALTVAGFSWYVAVDLTTPSDLTAIYNCSAFFAYVFSVPILREPLRLDKSFAVIIAIVGVLVVAYGDQKPPTSPGDEGNTDPKAGQRFLGNIVIGVGSVLYGLYEVLYKRFACPPEGCSPTRGVIFANTFGACIGVFTLCILWIPLPFLHWTGLEPFELPGGYTAWMLFLSVIANATFAGSFLVLISLTSPVLSSVAALLTIFIVAMTDWFVTGEPLSAAALFGGLLIMVAFLMLAWSTWREMAENEGNKGVDLTDSDNDDSDPRED